MLPTLAQLVATVTASNAYASILNIANQLGLSTTAWQPLGMARTIFATMSQVVASASGYVNLIAQGGYATTAAAMTDANGNPITTWMDLVSSEQYGNIRNPAVAASGVVGFANAQSVPYGPFPIGTLHLKNAATGDTFSNTLATEQIYGNAGSTVAFDSYIHVAADVLGTGTTVDGTVLVMTTPFAGVTVLPLGQGASSPGMIGTPAETNQSLLARDINKLGSISPNGAGSALEYVATTASIIALYGTVSAPITRAQEQTSTSTGVVTLYIANANGPALSGDAIIVQAAEQALAVPTDMTLLVVPASSVYIVVTATIYIMGSSGGIAAAAQANVEEYLSLVPIGGLNGSSAGEVPQTGILSAIQITSEFLITEIDLVSPSGNTNVGVGGVPILDPSSTFTVVVVPS
jgi:hypothetical protein